MRERVCLSGSHRQGIGRASIEADRTDPVCKRGSIKRPAPNGRRGATTLGAAWPRHLLPQEDGDAMHYASEWVGRMTPVLVWFTHCVCPRRFVVPI
jgi:hypothetical protein